MFIPANKTTVSQHLPDGCAGMYCINLVLGRKNVGRGGNNQAEVLNCLLV